MIMRKNILLLCILAIMGCDEGTNFSVKIPDVETGTLVVRNLSDNKMILSKRFDSGTSSFTRAEVYFGGNDLKLEILDSKGDESFSSIVSKDFLGTLINVNAVTTLAGCLFDKYQKTLNFDSKENNMWIEKSNGIFQSHFEIQNIVEEEPVFEFGDIQSLTNAVKYGLILKTFSNLSKDYENNISLPKFVQYLCDDLSFDGYLNGVGSSGFIKLKNKTLSSQTLKADFAGALYRTFQKEIPILSDENIFPQANTISVDHPTDLFDPNVKNYFFENEPPGDIEWVSVVVDAIHDEDVEFYIHDQMNAPVTIAVAVVFSATGSSYSIRNQLPSQDYFVSHDVQENFTETGAGKMNILASDVFGNSRSWSFDVLY